MTSLVGGIALLGLGALIGVSFSKKISNKKEFYKSLVSFNHDLLIEVEFPKKDLIYLLNKSYNSEDFNNVLAQKKEVIKGSYCDIIFPNYLNAIEQADLKDYFNKIGMQDSHTASMVLKRYGEIFSRLYSELLEQEKVKGALYKKMGVILGLIACIIAV